jgi:hypothetical protein
MFEISELTTFVCFQKASQPTSTSDMVKVFGCRPSQVAREGMGRRTETVQARTRGAPVRGYGDLRVLLRLNE